MAQFNAHEYLSYLRDSQNTLEDELYVNRIGELSHLRILDDVSLTLTSISPMLISEAAALRISHSKSLPKVTFANTTAARKFSYGASYNPSIKKHPFFSQYAFNKCIADKRFYTLPKNVTAIEPSVISFLGVFYPNDLHGVQSKHRPAVTNPDIMDNLLKFSKDKIPLSMADPSWKFASNYCQELFRKHMPKCRISELETIIDAIKPASPGFPTCLMFDDKKIAAEHVSKEQLEQFISDVANGSITAIYVTFLRIQLKERGNNKIRTILACDTVWQILHMMFLYDFNEKLTKLHAEPGWPFTNGSSIFYGGVDLTMVAFLVGDALESLDADSSDVSSWDGDLQAVILESVGLDILSIIDMVNYSYNVTKAVMLRCYIQIFKQIGKSDVLTPWFEVLHTVNGNKSGVYPTGALNGVCNFKIVLAAVHKRFISLSFDDAHTLSCHGVDSAEGVMTLIRLHILGDDNRRAMPAWLRKIFGPEVFRRGYTDVGMTVKPGSEVSSEEHRLPNMVEYNSRTFPNFPRIGGHFYAFKPFHMCWASIMQPERSHASELDGRTHHGRLLARCCATYLEGYTNGLVRRSIEEFVAFHFTPDQTISWSDERSMRKRLYRSGWADDLPLVFPTRRYVEHVLRSESLGWYPIPFFLDDTSELSEHFA
jgi:hypothetical protein